MSRIGKKPISILEGVLISIQDREILVKGPKGELRKYIPESIKIEIKEKEIIVSSQDKALWGLFRTLIFNMIEGVSKGYEKRLKIEGVGYTASLEGKDLILKVGFSHLVRIKEVPGILFSVEKNIIIISGIDKQLVGQISANIRKVKPPEPYKGKGIRYEGEKVRRKEGKKTVAAQ
ncbi:MAG: 50S ribosomal protein L6 [Candidatus Pacebacteria bacterium]|nr:50S ribosomal protein L6 [Candidatus Paceibacterota bacterium]